MNWKFIFNILGAITLFVLQLALVKSLPAGAYVNLSVVVLIFIVALFGLETGVLWFLINGFLADLFSFNFFGFYTLLFALILAVIYFLLSNVLTNRSLYSFLLMTAAAILIYDLSAHLVFGLSWSDFLVKELWRLAANFAVAIIIFYGLSILSHNFRPVFLTRNK